MRYGIRKGLKLPIGHGQLRGAFGDAQFQGFIEFANLVLRAFAHRHLRLQRYRSFDDFFLQLSVQVRQVVVCLGQFPVFLDRRLIGRKKQVEDLCPA